MKAAGTRFLSLLGVTFAAATATLAFGIVPFRDWLDQRQVNQDLRAQVEKLEQANRAYELRIDALNTDEEIEERARREYNLVLPDEEAYAVLPPPAPARQLPGVWPFNR
ncbi:MAG: septum formation initiator family protein [Acidimicrobiales bacterium]|nr:septum formation initiator family protein [Acidimicrobiales bacterium]